VSSRPAARSSLLPAVLLCGLITLVGCGSAGERTAGGTAGRPGGSPASASGSEVPAPGISAGEVEELERAVSAAEGAADQAERDAGTP
jgi:hypothetical protein